MEKCRQRTQKFKCDKCDKVFSYINSLYEHYRKDHDFTLDEEDSFPCDICGKLFFDEVTLKGHNDRIHLGITKDVKCHICGKAMQSEVGLKRHLKCKHGKDVNDEPMKVVEL